MKSFSILLVAVSLVGVSCERHEFEGPDGTKQLHEHHGAAAHGDEKHGEHAAHADDHAAKPADHAEKKEH